MPKSATITDPISFIIVGDIIIATRDVSTARTVHIDQNGHIRPTAQEGTRQAYRVWFISGGWVDLDGITADGFASLLTGAAF
jgi:hypothetical protein